MGENKIRYKNNTVDILALYTNNLIYDKEKTSSTQSVVTRLMSSYQAVHNQLHLKIQCHWNLFHSNDPYQV